MQLIKDIEIAYFRSFLKEKISGATDLNVVFGRNDSGKSNVLRALNLFFNQQTNPDLAFDFGLDFNHQRRLNASSGEGIRKFIYIKITFNTPTTYQSSLGDEFSIKRQWNISSGGEFHQEISRNVNPSRHQYATRLLNQIQFHYIPAVKDRKIFSWLFQKIYRVIIENADFSDALQSFAAKIQENTEELFQNLEPILGFKSLLAPPSNLTELFGALDVDTTSAPSAEALSLILQRGDGLQVRHIPEILRFISDHDKSFHIWGFEEPENSLELAFAFAEARRFIEIAKAPNKQLFVTSHSPAFFTIPDSDAAKYFVSRENSLSVIKSFEADDENIAFELMGDNFYLPLISKSIRGAMEEIELLKKAQANLSETVAAATNPMLFVEGETDRLILLTAFDKLIGGTPPFVIEAGGGTSKMKALCAEGSVLAKAANQRRVFVLADNDFDGRELAPTKGAGKWVTAKNNTKWWILKPTAQYEHELRKIGLDSSMTFFCIEDCLDVGLRKAALGQIPELAAVYKYNAPRNYPVKVDHSKWVSAANEDVDLKLALYSPGPDAKAAFAEYLAGQPQASFEYFLPLFDSLMDELASAPVSA